MVGGSLVSKDAERIAENSLIHCAFRLKLRATHLRSLRGISLRNRLRDILGS